MGFIEDKVPMMHEVSYLACNTCNRPIIHKRSKRGLERYCPYCNKNRYPVGNMKNHVHWEKIDFEFPSIEPQELEWNERAGKSFKKCLEEAA